MPPKAALITIHGTGKIARDRNAHLIDELRDLLGWPLAELSDNYATAVTDHSVNAGSGILGWIVKSWNPLSHGQYWGDDEVLDPLEAMLRTLL